MFPVHARSVAARGAEFRARTRVEPRIAAGGDNPGASRRAPVRGPG